MAQSTSHTWLSPQYDVKRRWTRLSRHRERFCPDSPFLPATFDLFAHEQAIASARTAYYTSKSLTDHEDAHTRVRAEHTSHLAPTLHQPFGNHIFVTTLSPVLALPTIWSIHPYALNPLLLSHWPTPQEYKYEGDDRIAPKPSTTADADTPHDSPMRPVAPRPTPRRTELRRFLPLPRIPRSTPGVGMYMEHVPRCTMLAWPGADPYNTAYVPPLFPGGPMHRARQSTSSFEGMGVVAQVVDCGWYCLPVSPAWALDAVARVPGMEEVFFAAYEVEETEVAEEVGVELLGKGMMAFLDAGGEAGVQGS